MNGIENTVRKITGNERFDKIYINSRDRVYRTALYYTKREDVAEEIMQDTFMEFYINLADVNQTTEENWLLRVAKHKALNWQARMDNERKKIEILEEQDRENVGEDLEKCFLKSERDEDMRNLSREIFTELQKENENWYEAIIHVYYMGKPQREVAKEMGVSIEVLHATLYRARRWIKKKYGKRYEALFNL